MTEEKHTPYQIAKELSTTMQCNCDLDNWEPDPTTHHSHVCRIHKEALAKLKDGSTDYIFENDGETIDTIHNTLKKVETHDDLKARNAELVASLRILREYTVAMDAFEFTSIIDKALEQSSSETES